MTDLISLFTNSLAAANKQASTLSQYADDLRRFERFLQEEYGLSLTAQQAGEIRAYMLDAYAQWLFRRGLEISTRNKYIIELKRFFGYLHDAELIPGDPAKILHCIKEPDSAESPDARKEIYTPDQLQTFLAAIASDREHCNDRRDIAIIALIVASGGMRASEVCSLNLSSMAEIRAGLLYCRRKGGHWRYIEVAPFAVPYLEDYLTRRVDAAPDAPLFLSTHGSRLNRNTLWKSLAHKQRQAELSTGIHIFRHMMLTEVEKRGGGAAARDIAGHKRLSTTNRYTHTTHEERAALVAQNAFANAVQQAVK